MTPSPSPMRRSIRRSIRRSWLLLLVLAVAAAAAAAADGAASCSSPEECCGACGADSYRCARGPCSSNVVTKGFFSISLPTAQVGFWDVVFSFYGMVPYLVPIAIALELLLHRRSWTRILAFVFIPILGVLNVIFVQSLGDCSECARPCGSCVKSNGMPSGHAANAIGFCLWLLLETMLGFGRRWSALKKALVMLGAVLLLVPVPYSRMYLGDHTELQVVVGSAIGVVFGILYFLLMRCIVGKHLDSASARLARGKCGLMVVNDFYETKANTNASESLGTRLLGQDRARAGAPVTQSV